MALSNPVKTVMDKYKAGAETKSVIKEINDFYDSGNRLKQAHVRQWFLNLAFFAGKQYVKWHKTTQKLVRPKPIKGRVRVVANQIINYVRTSFAKLTKGKPILNALAASPDNEDLEAAKMATSALKALWKTVLNMPKKLRRLALWFLITGSSFLFIYWDKEKGPLVANAEDTGEKETRMGEVSVDVLTPFELIVEDGVLEMEEARKVLICRARSTDYIEDKYGIKVEADEMAHPGLLEAKMSNVLDDTMTKGEKNLVVEKQLWQLPCKKYPEGRVVTATKDKILEGPVPFPYPGLEELPIVKFDEIPMPGRFWGMSLIEQLMGPQKEYNRNRSQMTEIRNKMSSPYWSAVSGQITGIRTLEAGAGKVLEFQPIGGTMPSMQSPPPLSPVFIQDTEMIKAEMDNIYGIHETTARGQAPPGVKAFSALALMSEQDDSRITPMQDEFADGLEKVGKFILYMIKTFYTEKRSLKFVGENNETQVVAFKGADLRQTTDVEIQAGSAFPQLKAAKQELVMELWNARLIEDPKKVLEMLDMGQIETLYEDIELDAKGARRENMKLLSTDPAEEYPRAEEWENHAVHMYEHNKMRKGAKYESSSPEKKAIIDMHIREHETVVNQAMMAMQQQQMMAQGPQGGAAPRDMR